MEVNGVPNAVVGVSVFDCANWVACAGLKLPKAPNPVAGLTKPAPNAEVVVAGVGETEPNIPVFGALEESALESTPSDNPPKEGSVASDMDSSRVIPGAEGAEVVEVGVPNPKLG